MVLVVFDTARADAFEPYGAPAGASPTVAQLASAGTAHPQAYSTGCWTVPGHGSMLTGLLPRSAGLGHAGITWREYEQFTAALEALKDRLLPEVLGRAGYETRGISTNVWISPQTGFSTGFSDFTHLTAYRVPGIQTKGWRNRIAWHLQALRARCDDGARDVEHALAAWLRSSPRRPFFWFANLMECHSPYLPPKPYNRLRPLGRIRAASEAATHLSADNIWRCSCGGFDVPPPVIRRMRQLYADSIRQLDDWLARLLELLDRSGVLDETQIVVTSDHGENFGDGGLLGHSFSLDDRLLRVPLVSAGPASLAADAGPLSLAGLPRVLADAIGLTDHPWQGNAYPDGVAVAQFDAPGTPGDERMDRLVERWGLGAEATRVLCTSFTCATDGRLKLFRRAGKEELVDLKSDPLERAPRPLGSDDVRGFRPQLTRLRAALDQAASEDAPKVVSRRSAGDADPEETARIEAQLRLLGYI